MYAPKKKSALARKEMRILRRLVGDDPDAPALFSAARRVATRRVVVKRHRHALPLHPKPDLQFKGRTTRYDVYLAQP
jgi:16S rRNA (guanine1516-N2)-methyltransferase